MTTPINVDEARVALKTWSLRIPKAQMALLNAALDRLEELEQAVMDWEIATSASCCKKNEATIERISAAMSCVPEAGDDLVEAVRLLVQERGAALAQCVENLQALGAATQNNGALRARVKELEADRDTSDAGNTVAMHETSALRAKLAEAQKAWLDYRDARDAAQEESAERGAQLETAKGLLMRGASSDAGTDWANEAEAFLSSKEGGEPTRSLPHAPAMAERSKK